MRVLVHFFHNSNHCRGLLFRLKQKFPILSQVFKLFQNFLFKVSKKLLGYQMFFQNLAKWLKFKLRDVCRCISSVNILRPNPLSVHLRLNVNSTEKTLTSSSPKKRKHEDVLSSKKTLNFGNSKICRIFKQE